MIVWRPYAAFYQSELISSGEEDIAEKRGRFLMEVKYMRDNWGMVLDNDPYYNANLSREREDFSIRI